jgi:hypothetical protein
MSDETMDLYLIQTPDSCSGDENASGYLKDLLSAYRNSVPVRDIQDFILRVITESLQRRRQIKKLVIGSHGAGLGPGRRGSFYIGKNIIDRDEEEKLNSLRILAPFFAKNADVFILACRTGNDDFLLRKVSTVLGGVRVHGYTDYITTTNYWLWASVDDGTDDEGNEVVCLPSRCQVVMPIPSPRAM